MTYGVSSVGSQTVIDRSGNYNSPDSFNNLLPYALKDVNIDFTRRSELLILYGFDAINNMILNVMYTIIGERDFEPTFGCNALNLIHEPNDAIIADQVEIELYDKIRYWVPYIDIALSGVVCQTIPDQQAYRMIFVYRERTTQIQNSFATFLSNKGKVF